MEESCMNCDNGNGVGGCAYPICCIQFSEWKPIPVKMEWKPIDTVPLHASVLFYRADAGVFYGQKTHCADWISEEEQEKEEYDEYTLFKDDCWAFEYNGAHRLEGDVIPTHWMPLPPPPAGSP